MKKVFTFLFLLLPLTFAFGKQKIKLEDGDPGYKWYDDKFTTLDDGNQHRIAFHSETDHEGFYALNYMQMISNPYDTYKTYECSSSRGEIEKFKAIVSNHMYGVTIVSEVLQDEDLIHEKNREKPDPLYPYVESTLTIMSKDFKSKLIECDLTLGISDFVN